MDIKGFALTGRSTTAFGDLLRLVQDTDDEVRFISDNATAPIPTPYRVFAVGTDYHVFFYSQTHIATLTPDVDHPGEWIITDANGDRLPGVYRPGVQPNKREETLEVACIVAAILENLTRKAGIVA